MNFLINAKIWIFVLILGVFMALGFNFAQASSVQEEIDLRNHQIDEIQKQIDEYQIQIEQTGDKAKTLAGEIAKLNASINQIQLEIKSLGLSIDQTKDEIGVTKDQIQVALQKIDIQKAALAKYIKILEQADHENLTAVLFRDARLSSFFDNLKNLRDTQSKAKSSIIAIRDLKTDLENKQADLENKQSDLEKLKAFQESAKQNLGSDKNAKNKLLKETKGQEAKYQDMVKKSQKDIQAIKDQIGYLIQNGISVEDAIKYGQLAAIRTGIRPEFLIAELDLESGLGINVGKCNRAGDPPSKGYRAIMKPNRDIQPFLEITAQLGLNPETTAVSCPQANGWGGAMGPAQFIPSTWMGYKDEVAQLTGHNPANPWNIEDAFVAAAAKLSRAGADSKDKTGEMSASKAYYCGNPKSTNKNCINYANTVQRKAIEIAKNL